LKLALGSVRFGMNYGISSRRDRIHQTEVFEILNEAARAGIDTIDTAYEYGESEKAIGYFLKSNKNVFKIISKLPKCCHNDVPGFFRKSLSNLNVNALYGYLIHNFESFKSDEKIWDELRKIRSAGKVKKIGFSLYYPSELEHLFSKKISFDMVQVPYSILDQRFAPYFQQLRKKGVEVYARSVFLQGLILKEPVKIPESLKGVSGKLMALRDLSRNISISIEALCLLFVALNDNIDKAVVGIGSVKHVEDNVNAFKYASKVRKIYDELLGMKEDDEKILVPSRWELKSS